MGGEVLLASDVKRQLDIDKVLGLLEYLGCQHITVHRGQIRCSNPDGDNPNAVCVYTDKWNVNDYTRPEFMHNYAYKDIVSFVQYTKNCGFTQAIDIICQVCDIAYISQDDGVPEILKWLNFVENNKKDDFNKMTILPENILTQYIKIPHIIWYNEGICCNTQNKFEICIDIDSERIVIPIRDEFGQLVGVKGRAIDNIEPKYLYLYPCPKSQILYGYYQNQDAITKQHECIVVEAEKSVLKLDSFGYHNAVAIGGKELSDAQAEKLLRMNVDIVFALDQDVTDEELQSNIDKLKLPVNITNIYTIKDEWGLLQSKESPCDRKDIWEILYKNFKQKV